MPPGSVTTVLVTHLAGGGDLDRVRDAVAGHRGREVTSGADRLVAAFESPADAVRCGEAIRTAVGTAAGAPGARVGVDAGEVADDPDGGLFGTPLDVAGRLCDLAGAGQILVSGVVRGLAARSTGAPTTPAGSVHVRGLESPVDAWSVGEDDDRADALTSPTRVLVADDQRLVRTGFRAILDAEPDITVVGEAADGLAALDAARRHTPDVVLMDIQMPRMDGLQAARELLATSASKVVILTTFDADEYVYEALRVGASGFLLKDAPPQQLVSAVRCAARGDALIDPSLTRRLIDAFGTLRPAPPTAAAELERLTSREREVLLLLARGLSNAEIAAELVVEETTVKTHVARVLMKLGVRDRVQAVIRAYETRLVTPS